MAELGVAASIIAVIQLVAAVTTQAYNYGLNFKNAAEDINEVKEELGHVSQALERLKILAEQTEKSGRPLDTLPALLALVVADPLARCNQALMELMTELTPASGIRARLSQRAKWGWRKEKVQKSLQSIVKQKMAFLGLLNVDQMSQTFEIGYAINKMSQDQIDTKTKSLIRWLSPTDPSMNLEAARKKHEDETGKWFTGGPEYAAWLEQPNSFLWLYGIPGCGKTLLCSEIIEETTAYCHTRDSSYHLAYFFFSFQEPEKRKASNLPRSILAQLLQQIDTIPDTLLTFYDQNQHGKPPERGVMDLIYNLLTGLHIFIVIDALDECSNTTDDREELCNILKKMHSWNYNRLHIIVTSREENDLTEALRPILTQKPIAIQGTVVNTDIRKYVRTQLRTDPKLSKWPPGIQTDIEETLVNKSGSMFRWAVCQFHSLSKCVCASDIQSTLSSLPRTLDETYERILINIPTEYRLKAITALQWIIQSKKELSLAQIADALIINPNADPPFSLAERLPDPFWISEILPGLITIAAREGPEYIPDTAIRGHDHIVEIAHFSVVEYLKSDRILEGPARIFHLEEEQANISILQGCIHVLKSYPHPTNQDRLRNHPGKNPKRPVSSLESYACKYLYDHVELLKSPLEPEVMRMVLDFTLNIDPILQGYDRALSLQIRPDWTLKVAKEPHDPLSNGLYLASAWGLDNMVAIFLDAGANINTRGEMGTPLQYAARRTGREIFQKLLSAGADVNLQSDGYGTALQVAASRGFHERVKILLDAGADVNLQGGFYGSALRAAWEDKGVMKMLLGAGAMDRNNTSKHVNHRVSAPGAQ